MSLFLPKRCSHVCYLATPVTLWWCAASQHSKEDAILDAALLRPSSLMDVDPFLQLDCLVSGQKTKSKRSLLPATNTNDWYRVRSFIIGTTFQRGRQSIWSSFPNVAEWYHGSIRQSNEFVAIGSETRSRDWRPKKIWNYSNWKRCEIVSRALNRIGHPTRDCPSRELSPSVSMTRV